MKRYSFILLTMVFFVVIVAGCGEKKDENENEDEVAEVEDGKEEELVPIAEAYIQLLDEGKYDEAIPYFDEKMAAEVTPAALEELWDSLEEQLGAFIDQEYHSTEDSEGYHIVLINGLFEADDIVFSITFGEDNKIAGFFLQ